jgi:hypothetical protein
MRGNISLGPKFVHVTEIRSSISARSRPVSTIRLSLNIVVNATMKASMFTSLNIKLLKSFKIQMSSGPNFRKDMQPPSRMQTALMRKLKCLSTTSRQKLTKFQLHRVIYTRLLINASQPIIRPWSKLSKS